MSRFNLSFRNLICAAIILQLAPTAIFAQELVFEGVAATDGSGLTTEVVGAEPVPTNRWPATFVFVEKKGLAMVGRCTATVIGKRTVLTAAHCIRDGATGSVKLNSGSSVKVVCSHHPKYADDYSYDFALCKSAADFSGFEFETINTKPTVPRKGDPVYLLGFGCTEAGGVDESFGVLYGGSASVISIGTVGRNYIRTKGGAAVCFGDSGGGAYLTKGANRVIIGVNSRGDISQYSSLSATSNPLFLDFLDTWTADNKLPPACGRGEKGAGVCRAGI